MHGNTIDNYEFKKDARRFFSTCVRLNAAYGLAKKYFPEYSFKDIFYIYIKIFRVKPLLETNSFVLRSWNSCLIEKQYKKENINITNNK